MGLFRPSDNGSDDGPTMSLLKWLLVLGVFGIVAAVVIKQFLI